MAQLWVNLPQAAKMTAPGYQPLTAAEIGSVELPDGAGTVRVVAGEFEGHRGPARTHTPINVWDVELRPDASLTVAFPPSDSVAVLVIGGAATINGRDVGDGELVVFERDGESIFVATELGTRFLVLNGQPIDEPIVGYGPFVMNTVDEIRQAFVDFERGDFGQLD
jgi:redox-sensitive bicupin YhaK (pirin superfamily)